MLHKASKRLPLRGDRPVSCYLKDDVGRIRQLIILIREDSRTGHRHKRRAVRRWVLPLLESVMASANRLIRHSYALLHNATVASRLPRPAAPPLLGSFCASESIGR